ncbi:Endo-1,4-beta-xylanase 1 [Colletotrichum sidae]|uniref:Beta-xylanase n=1 Tax=Colletotrichum sidae TaxID=1347389 RepID=A0A4V3I1N1_9PEZI|nr:Endo-1,4-beta-xylanase 1 [Colletotrichum sidae]
MRVSIASLALLALADNVSANLHSLAVAAGKKYFGTATDNNELADSSYTAITKDPKYFGQITPANGQKWDYTESRQGVFQYSYADVVPRFAKTNGQLVRCHTLLYRSQTPTWVTSGSWSKDQMTAVIKTHIENLVGHYKGQCYSWDVVNEAVDDEGQYRETVFYKVLGLDHITLAFNTAHAVDPEAKLYYNDYNIENPNPKQKKTVELVKYLQAAKAPLHGVGLQGHFIVGSMPSQADLETVANEFAGLGVDVAYTELDVKFTKLPYTGEGLQEQADAYAAVVKACLNVDACVGWTIWDWTDKYSWVPNTFPGQGGACLFDSNLKPKPAYDAVVAALEAAVKKSASTQSAATPTATATTDLSLKPTSTVVSTSVAESAQSTGAAPVTNTTAAETASATSSDVIASVTTLPLSSASGAAANATAIYTNGTATVTGSAGVVTSIAGSIVPGDVLPTATPGYAVTTAAPGGEVSGVYGSLPVPTQTAVPISPTPISPCERKRLRRMKKREALAARKSVA